MDHEGEAKNQEVIKPPLSSDSGQMTTGEHKGEIEQMLSKWFHRPLSDLPQDPREIAVAYIPTWSDLSPAERQACAVIEDGKLRARIGSRYEQARREQDGPADYCQFLTGFNSVRNPKPPAKRQQFELSDARCIELARMPSLGLAEWLELTGAGVGEYVRFEVTLDGVRFIEYTVEDMTSGSIEWQIQMARYNDLKPLIWPCSPAEILEFTDSKPFEIFAFFPVPDAFRLAVTNAAPTHCAPSGTPENAAPTTGSDDSANAVSAAAITKTDIGIPSDEIIEKFKLDAPWSEKLRKPDRYQYLLPALKLRGKRGGDQHRWNPAKFGAILIERKDRNQVAVSTVIYKRFTAWDDEWQKILDEKQKGIS